MTRDQAITKAQTKARRWGRAYMVTSRTAISTTGETTYLVFPKADKYAWAADEQLEFDTDHPDDLAVAWYAAGCPPWRRDEPPGPSEVDCLVAVLADKKMNDR